ncbi:hypothetical protein ACFWJ5_02530 [Streptomyces qaidamensis]|uniref:hypothetical protein n=1 Tax=Streptomyces qaidamensis TaxID=1783515 RepID=UPI003656C520
MTDDFTDADIKTICAALDIDTKTITDASGRTRVVVDEAGIRKLADHAPIGATAAHAMVDQFTAAARTRPRPLARIRTDVVALIVDRSQRTLTDAEQVLVATATRAEYQAAADITARLLEEARKHTAGLARIRELTAPYFATLPAGSVMGDVMALMSDGERAELDAVARALPVDGDVIIPRTV